MPEHSIESVALELLKEINQSYGKLEAQIGLQKICILGNHEEHGFEMKKIATKLCEKNYPATIVQKVPDSALPDFEKEKPILQKASLLVVIDNDHGGVVCESTYLIQNHQLLEKAILLISESLPDNKFFATQNHYVYYPCKIKYPKNNLVETAIMAAIQASHRLALKTLAKDGVL